MSVALVQPQRRRKICLGLRGHVFGLIKIQLRLRQSHFGKPHIESGSHGAFGQSADLPQGYFAVVHGGLRRAERRSAAQRLKISLLHLKKNLLAHRLAVAAPGPRASDPRSWIRLAVRPKSVTSWLTAMPEAKRVYRLEVCSAPAA